MVLKIGNNVGQEPLPTPAKAQPQKTQKPIQISGEKKEEPKTDTEQPVQGYYVETPTEENPPKQDIPPQTEEEEIDTSVDTNARITILPSIAINDNMNSATNAMEQTVTRAAAELFSKSSDEAYLKAQNLLQTNEFHRYFEDTNYPKRFNIYGKVIYEGTNQKGINYDPDSEITWSRNSERADLSLNWKSKSERTKAFVFGSYTHTKTDFNTLIKSTDETLSANHNDHSFFVLGAIQHRFKNNDIIMGSASHIDNPVELSKLTTFNGSYYLRKYMVLAEGKTTLYKLADTKTITKTDFTISLNPELAFVKPKEENSSDSETETNQETKPVLNPADKKLKTEISPFFDTQAITGSTEEGLGLGLRLKRTDKNSNLRISTFGKISTTQQEENNKYHVTFGSGIKYEKYIGAKSYLKAEAEVKDRYTFGHENILTASTHVLYTAPKFAIEAEAKGILISKNQPSYFGGVLRGYYIPNKHVSFYGEGTYTYLKEPDSLLKGSNVQAGVIVNF